VQQIVMANYTNQPLILKYYNNKRTYNSYIKHKHNKSNIARGGNKQYETTPKHNNK